MKAIHNAETRTARSSARPYLSPARRGHSVLAATLATCVAMAWQALSTAKPTMASEPDTRPSDATVPMRQERCDSGDAGQCNNLGLSYLRGEGVPADARLAFRAFERACRQASPDGCGNLGALYESGTGDAPSASQAARMYQQACTLGGALGCSNLGALFARGRGVARDLDRAQRLFALACETGNDTGCNNLMQIASPSP
jgi:TPR repeat protein